MRTLMIVDDSSIIRNKIARIQALDPIEVVASVGDGQQALEAHRRLQPDLITMDLTMPEMDGIACIEALMAEGSAAKILVVSALSDKATAILALQKGAHGFLCKPFSDEELGNALHELIES